MTTRSPVGQDTVEQALSRLVDTVRRAHDELCSLLSRQDHAKNDRLADWLYAHWYSCPATDWDCAPIQPGRTNLVSALRASLAATGRWERGWVALQSMPNNACLVGRRQLTRIVPSGDYANIARLGVPVAPGDGLAVLNTLDWVDEPPGFWGARSPDADPSHPLKRIYWSVGWDCVSIVLRRLVPVLDAVAKPWSLKCPTHAAEFARIDSLVVYVAQADWPVFESPIHALAPELASYLRDDVPPLTLLLARGVALADSPSQTQSFGQNRCAALAEGVRTLLVHTGVERSEAIALLKESLRASGIDPAKPWVCG